MLVLVCTRHAETERRTVNILRALEDLSSRSCANGRERNLLCARLTIPRVVATSSTGGMPSRPGYILLNRPIPPVQWL